MKFTAYLTADAVQFNLEPETEHEEVFLDFIKQFKGETDIFEGADIQENKSGYLRYFGAESKALAIRVRREVKPSETHQVFTESGLKAVDVNGKIVGI